LAHGDSPCFGVIFYENVYEKKKSKRKPFEKLFVKGKQEIKRKKITNRKEKDN